MTALRIRKVDHLRRCQYVWLPDSGAVHRFCVGNTLKETKRKSSSSSFRNPRDLAKRRGSGASRDAPPHARQRATASTCVLFCVAVLHRCAAGQSLQTLYNKTVCLRSAAPHHIIINVGNHKLHVLWLVLRLDVADEDCAQDQLCHSKSGPSGRSFPCQKRHSPHSLLITSILVRY